MALGGEREINIKRMEEKKHLDYVWKDIVKEQEKKTENVERKEDGKKGR